MTDERLKEIKDNIYCLEYDFAVRSDDSYLSRHLQYERDLYNEVIRLKLENKEFKKRLKKQVDVSLEQSKVIDKAIEYIEENYFTPTINDIDKKCNLLNILRGNDEDN